MKTEDMVCFYRASDENGELSNWNNTPFEYAGIKFHSSLQFIMFHKVMLFGQRQLGQKIMQEPDPQEIKKMSTSFEGYRDMLWDVTCEGVAFRGLRAKFQQNPELADRLLRTGDRTIAFCSPLDENWGTGKAMTTPEAYDMSKWTGKNRLGKVLMDVRRYLRLSILATGDIIPYVDIKNAEKIPEFNMTPGELQMDPVFNRAVQTYILSLPDQRTKSGCLWNAPLGRMDPNTSSLPRAGFFEMKQEIYDSARLEHAIDQRTTPIGSD